MIANYHTHTWRCGHATGREESYVRNAIDAGLKTLGFSDHGPQIFPAGYTSSIRMEPGDLSDYIQVLRKLGEKYKKEISIPVGLELEYYPKFMPDTLSFLRDNGVEYLLLGQHFVEDEHSGWYAGAATGDAQRMRAYVDQVIEAMQLGVFTYLAHPDLIHFLGDDGFYYQEARRLCREAKSCDIPLEINLLGLAEQRQYPNDLFWQAAGEEGCQVILGMDAHSPNAILDVPTEQKALELVKTWGLRLIHEVPLRKL